MGFSSRSWDYFHYSDSRGYLIFCCHTVAKVEIVTAAKSFRLFILYQILRKNAIEYAKHGDTLSVPPCSLVVVDWSAALFLLCQIGNGLLLFLLVFDDCFYCKTYQQHNKGNCSINQNACVPRCWLHSIKFGTSFEVPNNINPMPDKYTHKSPNYDI